VTSRKTENNNKQKVDALDLSGELSLVEDMNLSQERQRNKCVWLYLLRMSVRSLDSGEAYASVKYRNISFDIFRLSFPVSVPPRFWTVE